MADAWYYLYRGTTVGPLTEAKMADLITAGSIKPDTPVWTASIPERAAAIKHPLIARYFPPWATASSDGITPPDAPFVAKEFAWSPQAKPLRSLYGFLVGALIFYMLVGAGLLIDYVAMIALFQMSASGVEADSIMTTLATLVSTGGQILPPGRIISYVICVVLYLWFVYRAARNLHLSKARGITVSASGAVWWSFVPFANIGMIYSSMKQIWIASTDPLAGRRNAPGIFSVWWWLFIIGNVLGSASDRLTPEDTPEDAAGLLQSLLPAMVASMASIALLTISTFCLMSIIRQVTRAQETLGSISVFEE